MFLTRLYANWHGEQEQRCWSSMPCSSRLANGANLEKVRDYLVDTKLYTQTVIAANAIQLPRNPLHYHPPPLPTLASRRQSRNGDEDDTDVSSYVPSLGIAQMTLHVLAPAIASRGRQPPLFTTSRTAPPPNRVKAFFDDLVNIPSPDAPGQRPRLVYIRDFPTLAPTAPTWYPHLLSAVRARRTGPMARPSSPIACPMAIICGVTPSLVAQGSFSVSSPSSSYPLSGSQVLPLGRGRPAARPSPAAALGTSTNGTSLPLSEWGEDEHSTLARERRLRERLRRWECGGDVALLEDVPHLLTANSVGPSAPLPSPTFGPSYSPASSSSSPFVMSPYAPPEAESQRGFVLLGQTPFDLMGGEGEGGDGSSASAAGSVVPGKFFRAAVVLPSSRDVGAERQCRMARRREMNELAMRMGVGGVGGVLEEGGGVAIGDDPNGNVMVEDNISEAQECGEPVAQYASVQSDANPDSDMSVQSPESLHNDSEAESSNTPNRVPEEHEMWTDWSTRIESWSSIRQIADRAVGSVVASQPSLSVPSTPGLGLTEVPWSAIHRAWAAQRSGPDLRKAWMKDARVRIVRGPQHEHGVEEDGEDVDWEGEEGRGRYVDEVVEAVKQDKDLDPHEERLLGCIVDPGMSRVFTGYG